MTAPLRKELKWRSQRSSFFGKMTRMALLPFRTNKFTAPAPPLQGNLPVSIARLVWGAATVGASPVALGAPPRPLIELCWRVALTGANVSEDARSSRWVKTGSYNRLDPSEKSAVSYFLGMTQAKVTCEMLLGVPHLVHLDAVLALLGQTTKESRPDFIGSDWATMSYTVAVEAKGRTRGRTKAVTDKAKLQAGLLPSIVGTSSNACVASVASFDNDGYWVAYLEDPPGPYEGLEALTIEILLVAYYRPLVAALVTAGINEAESDDLMTVALLPGIDVRLGLPTAVVNALRNYLEPELLSASQIRTIGAALLEALAELPGKAEAADAVESWESRGAQEAEVPSSCTGFDSVEVQLGSSWFPNTSTTSKR